MHVIYMHLQNHEWLVDWNLWFGQMGHSFGTGASECIRAPPSIHPWQCQVRGKLADQHMYSVNAAAENSVCECANYQQRLVPGISAIYCVGRTGTHGAPVWFLLWALWTAHMCNDKANCRGVVLAESSDELAESFAYCGLQ